jgi:hypothetical protein
MKKNESIRRVLTEKKLAEIGARLEHCLRKTLRRLAEETCERFKFQVPSTSENKLQRANVKILWRC